MNQWQPQQYPPPQWQPQYPPPGPGRQQPRRRDPGTVIAFIIGGVIAVIIVIAIAAVAASHGTPQATPSGGGAAPAPSAPAAAPAKTAAASTVTFVVTGSSANVTYGDAGSNVQGNVPMHVTMPLGHPLYYSINAQLNGGGEVTCKILVGKAVVAQAIAAGGYNIALCEISRDPLTGQWTDTTSG